MDAHDAANLYLEACEKTKATPDEVNLEVVRILAIIRRRAMDGDCRIFVHDLFPLPSEGITMRKATTITLEVQDRLVELGFKIEIGELSRNKFITWYPS